MCFIRIQEDTSNMDIINSSTVDWIELIKLSIMIWSSDTQFWMFEYMISHHIQSSSMYLSMWRCMYVCVCTDGAYSMNGARCGVRCNSTEKVLPFPLPCGWVWLLLPYISTLPPPNSAPIRENTQKKERNRKRNKERRREREKKKHQHYKHSAGPYRGLLPCMQPVPGTSSPGLTAETFAWASDTYQCNWFCHWTTKIKKINKDIN